MLLAWDGQRIAGIGDDRQRTGDVSGAVDVDDLARFLAQHEQVAGIGVPVQGREIRQGEDVGEVQKAGQCRVEKVDRVLGGGRTVGRSARCKINARLKDPFWLRLLDCDESARRAGRRRCLRSQYCRPTCRA